MCGKTFTFNFIPTSRFNESDLYPNKISLKCIKWAFPNHNQPRLMQLTSISRSLDFSRESMPITAFPKPRISQRAKGLSSLRKTRGSFSSAVRACHRPPRGINARWSAMTRRRELNHPFTSPTCTTFPSCRSGTWHILHLLPRLSSFFFF